jgi:hypothetical protein
LTPRGGLIVVLGILLLGVLIGRRPPNMAGA